MSHKYKYFYANTRFHIPNSAIASATSSIVTINTPQSPKILSSINKYLHEVDDDHLFYTDVSGKYNCIVYSMSGIQVVKYKLQHSLNYNFCVKSATKELTYRIGKQEYPVVSVDHFGTPIHHINFDLQDFFDYNFLFFDLGENDHLIFYSISNGSIYINLEGMVLKYKESQIDDFECYIGKLTKDQLYSYGREIDPSIKTESPKTRVGGTGDSVVCFEIMKKEYRYMIWDPPKYTNFRAIADGDHFKIVNQYKFVNSRIEIDSKEIIQGEIYKIYLGAGKLDMQSLSKSNVSKVEAAPNEVSVIAENNLRNFIYNLSLFSGQDIWYGGLDLVIKIHRNIIRNLYEKYLYIDVLDIGIGKCRDVHTYQKYVNRYNIYGVEPNPDFAKACSIKNMFNETADSIFKFFKLKGRREKFHTIIFCNSYNFVTDPYITMKECVEFLQDGGRIIMVYMNNDKVVTEKNQFYEIRKGESNPALPANHVLKNRQNFIQIFTETTLVPPHYENQISEGEILDAMARVNKDLKDSSKPEIELIEKGSLVHACSEWLIPETKLFNSMFYYCVVGKPCKVGKSIIAFDTDTSTLRDYLNYLRKKNTYCNGLNYIKYKTDIPIAGSSDYIDVIIVDTIDNYEKLSGKFKESKREYDTLINIQSRSELEYSSYYTINPAKFDSERKKLLSMNVPHSKFGFNQNDSRPI